MDQWNIRSSDVEEGCIRQEGVFAVEGRFSSYMKNSYIRRRVASKRKDISGWVLQCWGTLTGMSVCSDTARQRKNPFDSLQFRGTIAWTSGILGPVMLRKVALGRKECLQWRYGLSSYMKNSYIRRWVASRRKDISGWIFHCWGTLTGRSVCSDTARQRKNPFDSLQFRATITWTSGILGPVMLRKVALGRKECLQWRDGFPVIWRTVTLGDGLHQKGQISLDESPIVGEHWQEVVFVVIPPGSGRIHLILGSLGPQSHGPVEY